MTPEPQAWPVEDVARMVAVVFCIGYVASRICGVRPATACLFRLARRLRAAAKRIRERRS